ncbi:MAG: ABC transporter ATP-binding protein [Culicoidibacterales bacterium]
MNEVISAKNISKIYGSKNSSQVRALNDISLSVCEGEFVAVMGPSGSGKTTLFNILSTIDKLTHGQLVLSGTNVTNMKTKELTTYRKDNLGFIFQEYYLIDTLTVKENIELPLVLSKTPLKMMKQKVDYYLKLLKIEQQKDKFPVELSGGQKQRVAIARSLVASPKVIFADEPTGALDSKNAMSLLQEFQKINTEEKVTILAVTHDPLVAAYAKRFIMLRDGEIYSEILRGSKTQREFYDEIVAISTEIGGGTHVG